MTKPTHATTAARRRSSPTAMPGGPRRPASRTRRPRRAGRPRRRACAGDDTTRHGTSPPRPDVRPRPSSALGRRRRLSALALRHDGVLRVVGRGHPAWKMPNRVHAEAGQQRGAARDRGRPAAAPERPPPRTAAPTRQRLATPSSACRRGPGAAVSADSPMRRSIRCVAASSAAAPRTARRRAGAGLGDRRGEQAEPGAPPCGRADEHERQLPVAARARRARRCR